MVDGHDEMPRGKSTGKSSANLHFNHNHKRGEEVVYVIEYHIIVGKTPVSSLTHYSMIF